MRKKSLCILLIGIIVFACLVGYLISGKKQVELYQLAPEQSSLMESYVIKTANNKLIVIDGGIDGESRPYLPAALRAIVGVDEGEYFEVEAWFLSHNHNDHINELAKMLNNYNKDSNYKINNIYFDFPDYGTEEYLVHNANMEEWSALKTGLDNYAKVNGINIQGESYYDELNGAVINTKTVEEGLRIEVDGVQIDILQTWAPDDGEDVNSNSLVMKVWVEGQSILFLNDLGLKGEKRLLAGKYKDELKSDIVQMAHHGQNGISKAGYDIIDADVHLWCPPIWVWLDRTGTYPIAEVREWVNGKEFRKADEYNIVSCMYDAYPTDPTSVEDWKETKDGMKILLPYEPKSRN